MMHFEPFDLFLNGADVGEHRWDDHDRTQIAGNAVAQFEAWQKGGADPLGNGAVYSRDCATPAASRPIASTIDVTIPIIPT